MNDTLFILSIFFSAKLQANFVDFLKIIQTSKMSTELKQCLTLSLLFPPQVSSPTSPFSLRNITFFPPSHHHFLSATSSSFLRHIIFSPLLRHLFSSSTSPFSLRYQHCRQYDRAKHAKGASHKASVVDSRDKTVKSGCTFGQSKRNT